MHDTIPHDHAHDAPHAHPGQPARALHRRIRTQRTAPRARPSSKPRKTSTT